MKTELRTASSSNSQASKAASVGAGP